MPKPGLYANIHAKRLRIKQGSGEKMRKPGSAGAPTANNLNKQLKLLRKNSPTALQLASSCEA